MGNIIRLEKWIPVSEERGEEPPCPDRTDELSLLKDELMSAFEQLEAIRADLTAMLEPTNVEAGGKARCHTT